MGSGPWACKRGLGLGAGFLSEVVLQFMCDLNFLWGMCGAKFGLLFVIARLMFSGYNGRNGRFIVIGIREYGQKGTIMCNQGSSFILRIFPL